MANNNTELMEPSADGTSGISFHATGVAERWSSIEIETEEIEDSGEQVKMPCHDF